MSKNSVIITGASDGIGRALALAFANRGYSVGLIARRAELLKEVAAACWAKGAAQAEWLALDIVDSARFRAALEDLDNRLGGATIFIANAGKGGEFSVRADVGALARPLLALNVIAAIDGLEFMKGRLIARGHGRLVGVGSIAGVRGLPSAAPYSASKAALRVYLEAIRIELKFQGVQVTEIAPGFVRTAMTEGMNNPAPMMDVEPAGEYFTRAILRGCRVSVAPWQYKPFYFLLNWMPDFLYDWLVGTSARKMD